MDSFDSEYLIAWMPSEFVDFADDGIHVNPEQCITWLSDTSVELARVLRTQGPLSNGTIINARRWIPLVISTDFCSTDKSLDFYFRPRTRILCYNVGGDTQTEKGCAN